MEEVIRLAKGLGEKLLKQEQRVTAAESCTGGGICHRITAVAGSSAWFEVGFVVYSNRAKQQQLGVSADTLRRHGAVSADVVQEMALGALKKSQADYAVAVSGIAGPDGGTPDKPVGTVWFAWAMRDGETTTQCHQFTGGRESVREQAVLVALAGLDDRMEG